MQKSFAQVPFHYLGVDANTASLFFAIFSRFEYALKQAGLFQRNGRNNREGDAKADWIEFSRKIADAFDNALTEDRPALKEAVAYMLSQPPDRHVRIGDRLDWVASSRRENERDAAYVLRLVRTVRNNLFHGGKYSNGQKERDKVLINHAMVILQACVGMHHDVNSDYFNINQ